MTSQFAKDGEIMCENSDDCINKALILANELLELADEGDMVRHDIGCGVLYGTLRDCAYKIRILAESELISHKKKLNSAVRRF
jgi:hypothetical protein